MSRKSERSASGGQTSFPAVNNPSSSPSSSPRLIMPGTTNSVVTSNAPGPGADKRLNAGTQERYMIADASYGLLSLSLSPPRSESVHTDWDREKTAGTGVGAGSSSSLFAPRSVSVNEEGIGKSPLPPPLPPLPGAMATAAELRGAHGALRAGYGAPSGLCGQNDTVTCNTCPVHSLGRDPSNNAAAERIEIDNPISAESASLYRARSACPFSSGMMQLPLFGENMSSCFVPTLLERADSALAATETCVVQVLSLGDAAMEVVEPSADSGRMASLTWLSSSAVQRQNTSSLSRD